MSQHPAPAPPPPIPQAAELILPLAAPEVPARPRATPAWEVRLWCALIAGLSALLLGAGLYLHPSTDGVGTHQQLGFPPCGLHAQTGVPCPTCGCTTAVSHLAHGHVRQAIVTQPFGAAVGLLAVAGLLLGSLGLATGRWFGPALFTLQWHWRSIALAGVLIFLGGWGYKVYLVHAAGGQFGWRLLGR